VFATTASIVWRYPATMSRFQSIVKFTASHLYLRTFGVRTFVLAFLVVLNGLAPVGCAAN
jgi:hypothetical protein